MKTFDTKFTTLTEKIEVLEDTLQLALEAANVGIWSWCIENNYLYWSERMFNLYGKSKSDFTYNYDFFKNSVHTDDIKLIEEHIKKSLENDWPYKVSFRVISDSGKIIFIKAAGKTVRDNSGKPIKMVGVCLEDDREFNADCRCKS